MTPKQREEQLAQDLKNIMATPGGRRYFWHLLDVAGLHTCPFNHSGSVTAFNTGRQSVAHDIKSHINDVSPDDWIRMQAEAAQIKLTTKAETEE